MKSLIFDSMKILLPKRLVLTYSLIATLSDTFYRIEIEFFKSGPVLFSKLSSGFSSERKIESLHTKRDFGQNEKKLSTDGREKIFDRSSEIFVKLSVNFSQKIENTAKILRKKSVTKCVKNIFGNCFGNS